MLICCQEPLFLWELTLSDQIKVWPIDVLLNVSLGWNYKCKHKKKKKENKPKNNHKNLIYFTRNMYMGWHTSAWECSVVIEIKIFFAWLILNHIKMCYSYSKAAHKICYSFLNIISCVFECQTMHLNWR